MELDAGILRESEKAAVGAILRLGGTGRLDLMQRIVRQHSPPPPPIEGGFDWGNNWFYATVAACRAGDLEMVKWLVRHPHGQQLCYGLMMGNGAEYVHWFAAAAEAGHVEVMKFLAEEDMDDQIPEALRRATAYGHLGAVKWLMERVPFGKPEHDVWILEVAVQYGRLDVAQYLHNLEVSTRTTILMDLAAEHGHLDILKWLHDVCDGRCSTKAMDSAATNGHFKVVKWLNEERSEGCTTDAMDGAAKNGHLEILKWLHHCRSEGCTPKAIVGAAENSHVLVVQWLQVHYPDLIPPLQNLVIHPPNQFEMLLFLHEAFPSTRRQENSDQPRFRLVHESNDEHVQAWLEQEYSSF